MIARVVFLSALASTASANGLGPATSGSGGVTGAPGEGGLTCGVCHSTGAATFGQASVAVVTTDADGDGVLAPGEDATLQITVSSDMGTPAAYGFQLVVLDAANLPVGTLTPGAGSAVADVAGTPYLEHDSPNPTGVWTVTWTAPAVEGDYTLYVAGTAVDGNGLSGGDVGTSGDVETLEVRTPAPPLCVGVDGAETAILAPLISSSTVGAGDDWQPSCGLGENGASDLAYEFTATLDGLYTFNTFGSGFDTTLSLWDNDDCATELVCNDDADFTVLQSEINWVARAGESVIVVVDGYSGSEGDALLNVAHEAPVCVVDSDIGSDLGPDVRAGEVCGRGDDVGSTCAFGGDDISYSWTAPADGTYTFSTVGSEGTPLISLREEVGCTEVACQDTTNGFAVVSRTMTAGEVVFISVHDVGSCSLFRLHIQDVAVGDADFDGVPDLTDDCQGYDPTGDTDNDGVCDDLDRCLGDDATGDADGDALCDELDFSLSQTPIVGGGQMTFTASNAPANANVIFLASPRLDELNRTCHPQFTTICTALVSPVVLGSARADAAGVATFTANVPSVPAGFTVHTEALWIQAGSGDTTGHHTNQAQ